MALITGNYLYKYFLKKTGAPYTGYFSPPQWNILFEEAIIDAIEKRYEGTQDMKFKDEMSTVIKTNVIVANFGNNSINLRPIPIIGLTNPASTNWVLTTTVPFAPLAENLFINISGVSGFVHNPNGTYPITGFTNTVKGTVGLSFTAPAGGGGTYIQYSGTFSFQNTSNVYPAPQLIDYIHLLNIKCKFVQPQYSPTIISSTNGSPTIITTNWYNKLRSSNWKDNPIQVSMSGWVNNTAANGSFYIKKINNLQFELYNDIYLQSPVSGIANETNDNIDFGMVYYNNANRYISTQKANSLNVPSWDRPGYERSGRQLNIYPMNIFGGVITTPCTEVTMDYICNPQLPYVSDQQNQIYSGIYVDANDTTLDLTTIYSEKFLYSVCDDLAMSFVESSRDMNLGEIVIQNTQP